MLVYLSSGLFILTDVHLYGAVVFCLGFETNYNWSIVLHVNGASENAVKKEKSTLTLHLGTWKGS